MKAIELNLPPGATICGELLDDYSQCLNRLSEDILQIRLPNNWVIDVGWHPAFEIPGCFQIVTFKGTWGNRMEQPIIAETPPHVSGIVQEIIYRLYSATPAGNSHELRFKWTLAEQSAIHLEPAIA